MEKLFECCEVAERYGVKIETIWRWIREEKLDAIVVGKGYRISKEAVEKFDQKNKFKGVKA